MKALSLAGACALALGAAARADEAASADPTVSQAVVTAPAIQGSLSATPASAVAITADLIEKTVNVLTPEDALRYLPDVLIRQRHVGDTQSPISTRTSGVGSSARSLIYVDGILVSALIGNNNTSASPKWGLVAPDAIDKVEVLYGPFAAAYAGNSIGSVIAFTTKMPERPEVHAEAQGASQAFAKYGDDAGYGTARFSGDVGDRNGPLAFRLGYNHLDSRAQPLTYATATVPATTSAAGTPVTGAFADQNRTNVPIEVLGSTAIEHQVQDNFSGRATFDLTPAITAAYSFGLFLNRDDAGVNSYLRDANGQPVYAGAMNIAGRAYVLAASTFSSGVYKLDESDLAQGLSVNSHSGGAFDLALTATRYDTLESRQRIPSGALPAAFDGGAGTDTTLDGTGWHTLDATGTWRPQGMGGANIVSFGAHEDGFLLKNPRYVMADWRTTADGQLQALSEGRTRTGALWAQDILALASRLKATLGLRYEDWRAYDGLNYSASPALEAVQPQIRANGVSPKATLAYTPARGWTLKASVGRAYRFPTVGELYQAITVGTLLAVPNPDLKPERALSSELSLQKDWGTGMVRLSLFHERVRNALISQTAPLPAGSTTLASYVQNVGQTDATGLEVVADRKNLLIRGLELSGWATFVDARTERDAAFPNAVGKALPQLPRWRGAVVASYAPTGRLEVSLAARYSDRAFGTIDDSDHYADTYQGFGAYLTADAHLGYALTPHLKADLGVDNLGGRSYFEYHPFPQRTFVLDLKWAS